MKGFMEEILLFASVNAGSYIAQCVYYKQELKSHSQKIHLVSTGVTLKMRDLQSASKLHSILIRLPLISDS
eukprot:c40398_g1_i1 orf=126-338(+)